MIKRTINKELIEILDYFPVLGLIGPRQVGKTTLAKELMQQLDRPVIYLDLENPDDQAKLAEPTLFFSKYANHSIILDEIQRKPDLFPVLRSVIDQDRKAARFIITGSASPELIRDTSESLAGRIAYKELTPFNILEINTSDSIDSHWFRGGFPLAYLAPSDKTARTWTRNFIQTYIEKDLPILGLQISPVLFNKFWTMLAHLQGNLVNYNMLSKSLEITSPTIKRYIHFLSQAFLVRELESFHVNIKKRLVKSTKIYIRDSGILHTILGITSPLGLDSHPVKGASWEGYIIEQIYNFTHEDFQLFFYRTHQGAECDLVLAKANQPIAAIEIKLSAAPKINKGFKIAIEDLQTKNNFVICAVTDNYPVAEKIIACNVIDFIENFLPKL